MFTVIALCVCLVVEWKQTQFSVESVQEGGPPTMASQQKLSRAGLLGQGLILYLAVCVSIVDSAGVRDENTEENKTVENARQVVKLAGNNIDSVILIWNGRF